MSPILYVTLNRRTYRSGDWSIGGLTVLGYAGKLMVGKLVKITVAIAGPDDTDAAFTGDAEVVRREAGRLAIKFRHQDSPTLRVLEYLQRTGRTAFEHAMEGEDAEEEETDLETVRD